MRKRRVVGRIYEIKYCWKDHKDRHKNRIFKKKIGQARFVYLEDIDRNIPITWRWAREDWEEGVARMSDEIDRYEQSIAWFDYSCSLSSVIKVPHCLLCGFFGIYQSFALLLCFGLEGQTRRPFFGLFARNIILNVLIGSSGDWQPAYLCCQFRNSGREQIGQTKRPKHGHKVQP